MDDLSPLAAQQALADQHLGTAALLTWATVTYLLARWLGRRRFPHAAAWLLFLGWATLVGAVPALRELDQLNPWFYGLRGVTLGFLCASMMSLVYRRSAEEDPPAEANPPS